MIQTLLEDKDKQALMLCRGKPPKLQKERFKEKM